MLKELSGFVVRESVEVVGMAIERVWRYLLHIVAHLISLSSRALELLLLRSFRVTKRRVSATNATRIGIASTSAWS
jgi:hypothetical protein